MIIEVIFYAVQCDICKRVQKDEWDNYYYQSIAKAKDEAFKADWHKEYDKHYCTNCYSFEQGNLILKNN